MKKLLTMLLVLAVLCTFVTSCEYLPEDMSNALGSVKDTVGSALGGLLPGNDETPDEEPDDNNEEQPPHEHEFVVVETKNASCNRTGTEKYECSCGETKEETLPALGHDIYLAKETAPTCVKYGSKEYKCTRCKYSNKETVKPTGHEYSEEEHEASRLAVCTHTGCPYGLYQPVTGGVYTEVIVYKFSSDDETAIQNKYDEVAALLEAAADYDPALHSYVEGSDLAKEYELVEGKYEELYELIEYVVCQYQIAQIEYHVDTENQAAEDNFTYISEYRTEWVAKFYEFSQPFYDSMYRDYFYYGMTENEIREYIFESNAVSNPDYKKLVDRNNEIELMYDDILDPASNSKVLEYYAEFVENNNKIAQILGYNNYVEYAYESVYDRDYSYESVKDTAAYAKKYIAPIFREIYEDYEDIYMNWYYGTDYVDEVGNFEDSFFKNAMTNGLFNDYIDLMSFTRPSGETVSFSDELNALMSNGNMFRGTYEGAYVTYLMGLDVPIAYFGKNYDSTFTVAHEFGHYMNEIYNDNQFNQSFDLLEMHSQGQELLFLSYIKDKVSDKDFYVFETYTLFNMTATSLISLAVDAFEQAVYTNNYTGLGSDVIMEDGKITADEYDTLYGNICTEFGIKGYLNDAYWRYVVIHAPCYYVSYSISALSVLQLYADAGLNSFESAQASYLKLFTYTDENPDMTTAEILKYAGMYSFTEEEMYVKIKEYFESN